ncbi:MAG: class F sortase [Candidatus Dormiibacterota bacterium]
MSVCIAGATGIYQLAPVLMASTEDPNRVRAQPMTMSVPRPPALTPFQIVDPTPSRLVIPKINVDAVIEARGLDSQRNMETPTDFRDVAWYKLGPSPGQPGNALINGHVNWWTGDAVFTKLGQLRTDDEVTVLRADGLPVHFKVTGTQTVDANARIAALFAPSPVATLTLITCTGVWNPLTQSDTRRLIVSAVLE